MNLTTGVVAKADVLDAVTKVNMRDFALDKFKVIRLGKDAAIVSYDVLQHWTMDGQEGPVNIRASAAWVNRRGQVVDRFPSSDDGKVDPNLVLQ